MTKPVVCSVLIASGPVGHTAVPNDWQVTAVQLRPAAAGSARVALTVGNELKLATVMV